jgi:hypothetical protein
MTSRTSSSTSSSGCSTVSHGRRGEARQAESIEAKQSRLSAIDARFAQTLYSPRDISSTGWLLLMAISFLHAADIHLDSPLKGRERYENAPVDRIRRATRRAFSRMIDLAIEKRVDFVLIAGDLYD